MGQGASQFAPDLVSWVKNQREKYPVPQPSPAEIRSKYISVVLYAYSHVGESTYYLSDIQKRFFNKSCNFRFSWSEERPTTSLSNLLTTTDSPQSSRDAIEAYRLVVEAISKNSDQYQDIINDMKVRYFDPRYVCQFRLVSTPAEYGNDLDPVFR